MKSRECAYDSAEMEEGVEGKTRFLLFSCAGFIFEILQLYVRRTSRAATFPGRRGDSRSSRPQMRRAYIIRVHFIHSNLLYRTRQRNRNNVAEVTRSS